MSHQYSDSGGAYSYARMIDRYLFTGNHDYHTRGRATDSSGLMHYVQSDWHAKFVRNALESTT